METAVVIPVGPGRGENVTAVLESLVVQTKQPKLVVLCCDGEDTWIHGGAFSLPTATLNLPKHEPGMEHPRSAGVRLVQKLRDESPRFEDITHVWFLDSDVIVLPDCLQKIEEEVARGGEGGVYACPYEWLPPGVREPRLDLRNDPRTEMFAEHVQGTRHYEDLSKGLGCFSGNLVWEIGEFARVGGYWEEIHHGRCEDGELGIRAVAMGTPVGLIPEARGWHLFHDFNPHYREHINSIDVPKINHRHPWVEGRCVCTKPLVEHAIDGICDGFLLPEEDEADPAVCLNCERPDHEHTLDDCPGFEKSVFVVEEDGKRFNARCRCGWEGNTALIWEHRAECNLRVAA